MTDSAEGPNRNALEQEVLKKSLPAGGRRRFRLSAIRIGS
jgi:hypothetical protein